MYPTTPHAANLVYTVKFVHRTWLVLHKVLAKQTHIYYSLPILLRICCAFILLGLFKSPVAWCLILICPDSNAMITFKLQLVFHVRKFAIHQFLFFIYKQQVFKQRFKSTKLFAKTKFAKQSINN